MTDDDLFLLEQLARGVDVRTSRPLPKGHLLLDADVRDVLRCALDELRPSRRVRKAGRRTSERQEMRVLAVRHGLPWASAEVEALRSEFLSAVDFNVIARHHGRTREAILSQLRRMGLVRDVPFRRVPASNGA